MDRLDLLIEDLVEYVNTALTGREYHVTESATRTFPAAPALIVEGTNGDVAVRSEDRDDVVVDVTWRGRELSALDAASVETNGGDDEPLRIAVEHGGDASDVAVDLSVVVPRGMPVDRLETVNGTVTLVDAQGDATLVTRNGSIAAERVAGALVVEATNGSISASEVPGIERIETKNGTVDLEIAELDGDATVRTATGQLSIRLDPSIDLILSAETAVGSIEAPLLDRSVTGIGAMQVTETLGDGGPELHVETSVGAIDIEAIEADDEGGEPTT